MSRQSLQTGNWLALQGSWAFPRMSLFTDKASEACRQSLKRWKMGKYSPPWVPRLWAHLITPGKRDYFILMGIQWKAFQSRQWSELEKKGRQGAEHRTRQSTAEPRRAGGGRCQRLRGESLLRSFQLNVSALRVVGHPSPQPVHVLNGSASLHPVVMSWLLMGNNIWSNWQLCEDR